MSIGISAGQVAIMFSLMALGWMAYRLKWIGDDAVKGMTKLLLFIVTPAVIVQAFLRPFDPARLQTMGLVFALDVGVFAVTIGLSAVVFSRRFIPDAARRTTLKFGTTYSNAGFLGIPLAQALLGRMTRHDIPLRETEFATYSFDVLIDQGGYFELKRHRMMTQTAQSLTARLGYAIPRRIEAAGMKDVYCRAMDAAQEAYEDLAAVQPQAAGYLVPNGFNRRVLLGCNWRSLDHFVSLRAAPNAHFSMRRLAQRMAEQARAATPLLGSFLRVPPEETWQQIEHNHFVRC